MNYNFINADLFLSCVQYNKGLGDLIFFSVKASYSDICSTLAGDNVTALQVVLIDDKENVVTGDIVVVNNDFYISYHCINEDVVFNSEPDSLKLFTYKQLIKRMSNIYQCYD